MIKSIKESIDFVKNLLKLIFRKKNKQESKIASDVPDNVIKFPKKIRWIKENIGIEKTNSGYIVHAIDAELPPEEIIKLVKMELLKDILEGRNE